MIYKDIDDIDFDFLVSDFVSKLSLLDFPKNAKNIVWSRNMNYHFGITNKNMIVNLDNHFYFVKLFKGKTRRNRFINELWGVYNLHQYYKKIVTPIYIDKYKYILFYPFYKNATMKGWDVLTIDSILNLFQKQPKNLVSIFKWYKLNIPPIFDKRYTKSYLIFIRKKYELFLKTIKNLNDLYKLDTIHEFLYQNILNLNINKLIFTLSHGDINFSNILKLKSDYYFIDFEFSGFYDITYDFGVILGRLALDNIFLIKDFLSKLYKFNSYILNDKIYKELFFYHAFNAFVWHNQIHYKYNISKLLKIYQQYNYIVSSFIS